MKPNLSHPSKSDIQIEIELKIIEKIAKDFQCENIKKPVKLKGAECEFEFDLFNEDKKLICEVYAGIDNLNPGSRKKIIADCLKMIYAESILGIRCQKILVFIDENIKKQQALEVD